jgi:hypothetical protein
MKKTYLLLLSCLFKVLVDFFLIEISIDFGLYGLNKAEDYFYFKYFLSWVFCLPLFLIISFFYSKVSEIFDLSLIFLFYINFVPLASIFWIQSESLDFLIYAYLFWIILFIALFLCRNFDPRCGEVYLKSKRKLIIIEYVIILIVVFLALYAYVNLTYIPSFNLETVYARRFVFYNWLNSNFLNYLYTWSTYVLAIYLVFLTRTNLSKAVGFLYIIFIFSISGDKIYLFLVFYILILKLIFKTKKTIYVPLLLSIIILLAIIFYYSGEIWVPSLVHRYISLPSDISYKMASVFESDLLMYAYSFLSPFFEYKNADVPSKIIGDLYYNIGDNATASFLVDMYINIGYIGILLSCSALILFRFLAVGNSHSILIVPFIFQLIDTPMPTAFLTGGGFLSLLIIYFYGSLISKSLMCKIKKNN